MASQPDVSEDAEVHRLLSELKQYTPSVGNLDQPATAVQQLWTDLHFAWWKATVAALPPTSDESALPSWGTWIQAHTTPAGLDVALHWVFGSTWMDIGVSGVKDNPYARIKTIANRLGMDLANQSTPWLLFLFLGTEVLSSVRALKIFSAWLGRRPSLQDPAVLFATINDKAVLRHGINNIVMAPKIMRADLNHAMDVLKDTYPDTSITTRETARPHQTTTPVPSSGFASPMPGGTAPMRPERLRQPLIKRPRYPTTLIQSIGEQSPVFSIPALPPGSSISIQEWVDDTRQSVEVGRRVGEPFFDPDVSRGNSREGTSSGSPSADELQQYVHALRVIRRVNLSSSGHDNFRAITDSLFNLAGVALSELVHEHGVQ